MHLALSFPLPNTDESTQRYEGTYQTILELKDTPGIVYKVIYRKYASLYFVCGIGHQDNELLTLEIIHRYVEVLDRYFGSVGGVRYTQTSSVH